MGFSGRVEPMRSAAILLTLLAGVVGAWLLLGREPVQPMRDTSSAPVAMAPVDQPWGERAAYVEDPDGNLVMLVAPAG